jgi:carboxyvinyl-carboxyphosphonate phosphorylmutase
MVFQQRRRRFRAVLAGDSCLHPASVYDALSARIAEDIGFETGMFAGSVASLAVLGAPDIAVITLTEFAEQIRRITRAGNLPLLVDADHGYGNAHSVARTVEELEVAGVAALTIEDTALPQGFGESKPRLVSRGEGLGKVRAALAARRDPDLTIVARTSALATDGVDEAVARAKAYAEAGADALFLVGATAPAQIDAVRAVAKLPVICVASPALGDAKAMAARGIRIALQGHQPIHAAIAAVHRTLAALRAGADPANLDGMPSPDLVRTATREETYAEATRRYLA